MSYQTSGKITFGTLSCWGSDVVYNRNWRDWDFSDSFDLDFPYSCIEGDRFVITIKLDVTHFVGTLNPSQWNFAKIKKYRSEEDFRFGYEAVYDGFYVVENFKAIDRWVYFTLRKNLLQTHWINIKDSEEVIVASSDNDIIDKSLPNGNYILKPEKEYKYVEIPTGFGKASTDASHSSNMIMEIVGR